ncbi:MAG: UDP-galactopyranose mutase [Parabacteroides sp.]|nr:UDP-galactopyranose mutase [Parabacteroides sp.]
MKYDCVIVGAGLAGATSARLLAEAGLSVIVVEVKRHIAGQCYDYKDESGITIHKYGPHIFHTQKKEIWDFVNRFSEFSDYQHRVLSYAEGQYYKFPINRDTVNSLFGLNLKAEDVTPFFKKQVEIAKFDSSLKSFRDVVVSQVGERLYKVFFESYTRKQWSCNPADLSGSLAGRIPIRTNTDDRYFSDPYQGIPTKGYTAMVDNMLDHEKIHILSGCDYFSIKDQISFSNLIVYTGLLDRFFDYQYGHLQYRSVDIKLKTLDMQSYLPVAVVNYPNDYDWTRITEFKKLTGEDSLQKTVVCYEYPKAKGDPFYTVPTEDNLRKRILYMNEAEKLERSNNYLFIGRLAEYQYYNMDRVIEVAKNKIEKWLSK